MKYSRHLLIGLLALFLGGCGTTVQESLKVQPMGKTPIGMDKTVVILPFADYSNADNLETAFRRNLFVSENITDQFGKYGFHLPVQEDVFFYLADQKIINVVSYDRSKTSSLEYEMKDEWSAGMKEELQRYIELAKKTDVHGDGSDSLGTHGLTQQEVVKIGRHFSADYIVRGRIIQYKDRQDPSWNPVKKGLITFVTGVTNRIAFGQAESEKYDELNNTLAGAADAAFISGVTDGNVNHAIAWGAAGAVLGNLAHHSGRIPQAVVQLRVWVQDAYTGNVVWTNRVDVKVSPESVLADYQYDALFEKATEKAISTLVDDFAQVVYNVPPPTPRTEQQPSLAAPTANPIKDVAPDADKDGVADVADHCSNTPAGVLVNAFGCPSKEILILEGVHFRSGSAALTPNSLAKLDKAASALVRAPHVKVEVAGYTDSVGDSQRNLDLSTERSLAVVQYLTSKGVAATQLTARGYGEENPIASNATAAGRQKNRRIELIPMTQ